MRTSAFLALITPYPVWLFHSPVPMDLVSRSFICSGDTAPGPLGPHFPRNAATTPAAIAQAADLPVFLAAALDGSLKFDGATRLGFLCRELGLAWPLGRISEWYPIDTNRSDGEHFRIGTGAENAVPGTEIARPATPVRTELPTVPRAEDDVHPLARKVRDHRFELVVRPRPTAVFALRVLGAAVVDSPGVDQ